MLIKNYELGFSFEISDDYSEIKESSYPAFNVGKNTLHYFIQLDDAGEISKVFSICKDKKCENEETALNLVKANVDVMEKVGFKLISENDFETHLGRKIYRRVFEDEEGEHTFVTYFTVVHNTVIASTVEILDSYDEYEEEMYAVFVTINEF